MNLVPVPAISFKRHQRELSNDVAEHRSISKNSQYAKYLVLFSHPKKCEIFLEQVFRFSGLVGQRSVRQNKDYEIASNNQKARKPSASFSRYSYVLETGMKCWFVFFVHSFALIGLDALAPLLSASVTFAERLWTQNRTLLHFLRGRTASACTTRHRQPRRTQVGRVAYLGISFLKRTGPLTKTGAL